MLRGRGPNGTRHTKKCGGKKNKIKGQSLAVQHGQGRGRSFTEGFDGGTKHQLHSEQTKLWEHWELSGPSNPPSQAEGSNSPCYHCPEEHVVLDKEPREKHLRSEATNEAAGRGTAPGCPIE